MKLLILLFSIFITITLKGQFLPEKNLHLTVSISIIDSNYRIKPKLSVLSDTFKIQIHKKILFGNEDETDADCIFYLQKIIQGHQVNMYNLAYRDDFSFLDRSLIEYGFNDSLKDSVLLNSYLPPLETGTYRTFVVFRYYLNGIKKEITSDDSYFEVPPK